MRGHDSVTDPCYRLTPESDSQTPMPDANPLAYLMLALWPVASWMLFTKMDPARALIWTVLGAYMLLPPVVALDLPLVPDIDKDAAAGLAALAAVLFLLRERFGIWPESWVGRGLIVLYILSPFATVLTNSDAIWFPGATLPALRIYDSLAVVGNQVIALIPFFLARRFLAGDQAMRAILVALMVAGLIYSLPMLVESRLSPQLNLMVYGFFQHDFSQAIRFGGFRPFVFMPHGLWVAFFAMMCFIATVTLFRAGPAPARPRYLMIALYLLVVLLFCRSAGPVVYAILLVPVVMVLSRRMQLLVAGAIVAVVISYPLLRGLHLVPVDEIMRFAMGLNPERGASLQFRILNEELLLDHAAARPWFGWGLYGRGLLHDPVTGEINVIADGGWIIALGTFGWAGYIAAFGLLALPVALMAREALRQSSAALSPFACAVTLILAVNLFDLLPNDTQIPFTWLMAGAVLGHAEALRAGWKAAQRRDDPMLKPGRTVL
ncbi:hypothetical protein [Pseudotabrizicola sp. 4114]|uniref:hypothetical protein n=1 Tax=Pseudotabrizicola sp. 4114 TaxID=2817731 RepID=UPI002857C951|nr:hypothetical protein [Pseudorhodobacter sp. 4114]